MTNRTKQMVAMMKAARNAIREGRCATALDALATFEYARGARHEAGKSPRASGDNWKLTTGTALNLRSAFRDRCLKPSMNKGTRR